jgi:hypothetical protein
MLSLPLRKRNILTMSEFQILLTESMRLSRGNPKADRSDMDCAIWHCSVMQVDTR